MSGLVQGQEKLGTYKLHGKKKGTVQVGIVPVNFSSAPKQGYEGNIEAHIRIAASNASKQAKGVKKEKTLKTLKKLGKIF